MWRKGCRGRDVEGDVEEGMKRKGRRGRDIYGEVLSREAAEVLSAVTLTCDDDELQAAISSGELSPLLELFNRLVVDQRERDDCLKLDVCCSV